jgi:hypothetical protein
LFCAGRQPEFFFLCPPGSGDRSLRKTATDNYLNLNIIMVMWSIIAAGELRRQIFKADN